ncbi:hypothetical protein O3M35_012634 [Rhynocoris fuscipes]|uniref:TWiK family of potassium channels protein 18 n=1 Tax=Rhynocoris fuscipes TaxID=488301 RepID=A0AAW1CTS6_9HEMI
MYGKIWTLSRKWFTHIFLFLIIALYSLMGGFLFHHIEGRAEQQNVIDIIQHRKDVLLEIRQFFNEFSPMESEEDEQRWLGRSTQAIREYEAVLLEHFKQDTHIMSKGDKPMWDFWSSVFFCGTIFTTIGKCFSVFSNIHRGKSDVTNTLPSTPTCGLVYLLFTSLYCIKERKYCDHEKFRFPDFNGNIRFEPP